MKLKQDSSWLLLVTNLPRNIKKSVQLIFDFVSLSIIYFFLVWLVIKDISVDNIATLGIIYVVISLLGFKYTGVYRAVIRFSGIRLLESIGLAQIFAICVLYVLCTFLNLPVSAIFLLLLFLMSVFVVGGGRLAVREIIYLLRPLGRRILIYGAGKAGAQLLASIRPDANYDVAGFIDDDKHLQSTELHGLKVFSSSKLKEIVEKKNVSMVVLAMPGASRQETKAVLDDLEPLSVVVKMIPKISDLLDGKGSFGNLEEVRIEELLGRERVSPDEELMRENISNKVVLVTGAGGSIGSELCRQIVTRSPKKLILVELSELALFNIQQELEEDWESIIIPLLSSVGDERLMHSVISEQKVDTVYHAAAYKHVPLIEDNPFAAINNNVFGTNSILQASISAGVSSFTLVSTDKAVRPTNVMGASKRLAEILCQIASNKAGVKTKIALVRFGNVMGSSGSVLPKFRQQIKEGGPVTVTHPEMTRYFMMIPEAVELVMQASSLARGGEVFVLDMGGPIKITDLVKKLIRFSGNVPKNKDNPQSGTIDIKYTGLRPGEKLYEELLISGDSIVTDHPKIRKANESYPTKDIFDDFLYELQNLYASRDESVLREVLARQDIGYVDNSNASLGEIQAVSESEDVTSTQFIDKNCDLKSSQEANVEQLSSLEAANKDTNSETHGAVQYSWVKRLFLNFLHKYFLLSRPLTMGVRCVVLNDLNEVLLVKHTYVTGWDIPGGGVNSGESAEIAVRREFKEETMYKLTGSLELVGIYHYDKITKRDHVVVFFSKTFELGSSKINALEIKEAKFFPLESLPEDLDASSRDWILAGLEINPR